MFGLKIYYAVHSPLVIVDLHIRQLGIQGNAFNFSPPGAYLK